MNTCFSSPVRVSVSHDVCEHANGLDEWVDNRYHQLERKAKFQASLSDMVVDGRIRITEEVISTPLVEQFGRVPSDKVLLLKLQSESDVLLNGRFVNSEDFHISSGTKIHAVAKAPARALIVTIEKGLFFELTEQINGAPTKKVFESFITPVHGSVLDFKKSVGQSFTECTSMAPRLGIKRLVGSIQDIMMSESDEKARTLPPSTRAYIVEKSCELLFENFSNEEFGVLEMCNHLRVSRRTLQYSFESIMGMSPSNYVRTVRLNTARKLMLLSPQEKIQGAALDAGFTHLGRFSKYYQDFFGELPSETLGRFNKVTSH